MDGGHATMGFFTFKLKRGGCFFFRHIEIIPERFQWLAIRFVSLISALGRYLSVRFQLFFCVLFILIWLFCDWREFWIGIVGYLHFMEISLELISSIISLDHPPLGYILWSLEISLSVVVSPDIWYTEMSFALPSSDAQPIRKRKYHTMRFKPKQQN